MILTINAESFLNFLNPTGYVMHQQVQHSTTLYSVHPVLMFFVFILKQRLVPFASQTDWFL
jgi:hypothetical protein